MGSLVGSGMFQRPERAIELLQRRVTHERNAAGRDRSGWISLHHCPGSNRHRHYTPSGYYRAATDRHTWQNDCTRPNEYVFFDLDSFLPTKMGDQRRARTDDRIVADTN